MISIMKRDRLTGVYTPFKTYLTHDIAHFTIGWVLDLMFLHMMVLCVHKKKTRKCGKCDFRSPLPQKSEGYVHYVWTI
jgi:hypothetical protein